MRNQDFFLRKFSPTTTHLAFFEMPVESLAQALFERATKINEDCGFDWSVRMVDAQGDLESKLNKLLPLTSIRDTKVLVSETKSPWSAYIPNGYPLGGDVHSEPRYLSGVLKVRTLSVILVEDIPNVRPGSIQFIFHDGVNAAPIMTEYGLQYETPSRSIYAHKESKWEFGEHGEPFSFEDQSSYLKKRVKDRLTVDMVERYCHHLGARLFDLDFYLGMGFVIQTYVPPNAEIFSSFPNAN